MRMECRWQQPQLCNSLSEVYASRQRVDSMYLWRRRSESDGQWRHDPSRVLNSVVSWCLNMAASEFDAEDEALHWLLTGFCRSAKQIPFNWFASKQINHSKHAEVRGLEPTQEGNSQQMARALNPSSDPEAASAFSRDPRGSGVLLSFFGAHCTKWFSHASGVLPSNKVNITKGIHTSLVAPAY
jgi:hypothetical protein